MRILMLALLLCGTAGAQTAPMYRTVAPDGTVTFSDLPLSDQSEMISVLVRASASQSQSNADDAQANDAESLAAEMAENCTRAQEQERSIANSTRLYRVLPSGERQFLTDEEIAEARDKAAADVAQWCQPAG
jgi:hypothetical protein